MAYKDFVLKNLQVASKIATDNFEKVESIEKGVDHNQVLTQTDIEIGKFLVNQIKKNYQITT